MHLVDDNVRAPSFAEVLRLQLLGSIAELTPRIILALEYLRPLLVSKREDVGSLLGRTCRARRRDH